MLAIDMLMDVESDDKIALGKQSLSSATQAAKQINGERRAHSENPCITYCRQIASAKRRHWSRVFDGWSRHSLTTSGSMNSPLVIPRPWSRTD